MHRCLGRPHGQLSPPATPASNPRPPLSTLRRRPRLSLATSTPCPAQPWPCPGQLGCLHRQGAHSRSCIVSASSSPASSSSSSSGDGGGNDTSSQEQPVQGEQQQQQQYEVHPAMTQQQQERQQSMLDEAAVAAAAAAASPATAKPQSRSPTPASAAAAAPPPTPTPPAAAAGGDQQAAQPQQHQHKRRLPRPPSPQQVQQVLQMFPTAARPSPVLAAFLAGGALMSGMLLNWAAGTPMRRSNPYTMHVTFQHASKIGEGTPVRMKGVQIGAVASVAVNPSHIDVVAVVQDAHNIVPVGSRVDINQFGLAADPFVDISPPEGCRVNPKVGPHHPKCQQEGLIVCDGQQIAGSQGGSMDYMMKQFLKYQTYSRVKVIVDEYRDG